MPDAIRSERCDILRSGILGANFERRDDGSGATYPLVAGRREGKFNLLSVYGLHDWPGTAQAEHGRPTVVGLSPTEEINVLVESLLKRAPSNKPVVVPVMSNVDFTVLAHSPRVRVIDTMAEFDPGRLKAGDIVLVKCSTLPPDEFNRLVKNSDVFIAEGSNSISFAKQNGIPFIVGGRQYSVSNGLKADPAYDAASKALTFAFPGSLEREPSHEHRERQGSAVDEFTRRYRRKVQEESRQYTLDQRACDLGQFIDACFEGTKNPSYAACRNEFTARPDAVFAALMMVRSDQHAATGAPR